MSSPRKLTDAQVTKYRRQYYNKKGSGAVLAKKAGMSAASMLEMIRGDTYSDIPMPDNAPEEVKNRCRGGHEIKFTVVDAVNAPYEADLEKTEAKLREMEEARNHPTAHCDSCGFYGDCEDCSDVMVDEDEIGPSLDEGKTFAIEVETELDKYIGDLSGERSLRTKAALTPSLVKFYRIQYMYGRMLLSEIMEEVKMDQRDAQKMLIGITFRDVPMVHPRMTICQRIWRFLFK